MKIIFVAGSPYEDYEGQVINLTVKLEDGVIYKKEGKYCFYRTCEKNLALPSTDV